MCNFIVFLLLVGLLSERSTQLHENHLLGAEIAEALKSTSLGPLLATKCRAKPPWMFLSYPTELTVRIDCSESGKILNPRKWELLSASTGQDHPTVVLAA